MGIKFIDKEQLRESYNPDGAVTTCYWFDVTLCTPKGVKERFGGDYAIQERNGRSTLINWDREDIGDESPLYKDLKKLTDAIKLIQAMEAA